jgi:poly(3-hydroxybutyrate) depolymerase
MANKISCLRGNVVSAMAAVAGPGFNAACTGPSKTLLLHNPSDPLVPFAQGKTAERFHTAVNRCQSITTPLTVNNLSCEAHLGCEGNRSVLWCGSYPALGNEPHSWPVNGGTTILGFFGV